MVVRRRQNRQIISVIARRNSLLWIKERRKKAYREAAVIRTALDRIL